jgi:ribose 5-phosphate isomerase A
MLRRMDPKQRAADAALEEIRDGQVVGLGTGSTAERFIVALAEAVRSGRFGNIRGVPTSAASERLARDEGIPLVGFDRVEKIDITIDGADEIAPNLDLIKGLGGALLREKLVAQNSKRLVIIADESKLMPYLGARSPLPVEVARFGLEATERFLRGLGCQPALRRDGTSGAPLVTDNGNHIFDCRFARIDDAHELHAKLKSRAGIVEHGLFLGIANLALVATSSTVKRITR